MYNCIQSHGWLPYAANRSRFYAVEFKLFHPRIFLISDGRVLLEQYTVNRHVNSAYLRFLTDVALGILRSVSVGKTYRHLRPGGIASGAGVISQQHDVLVAEHRHVFDCVVVQPYHSLTK